MPFDLDAYAERVRTGGCFVCALVAGEPGSFHEIVYEDADHVAFLSRYPTLEGYTLVCPKRHVEDAVGGFDEASYLAVQRVVRRVGIGLRAVLPVERVYVMSLGSMQGNAHVHWHVAPLPPGVPYGEQQFHALMAENGVLDQSPAERAALAERLRAVLDASTEA
ncbi:HIT family protein [Glycomyces paridis]|uniref:HIT family protein n=1 Tax=Glycomyces paridis TaxID=2126555 RepID=A0A4S8PBN6_9ACTN|nr:HIT family protein [Glycomyces paridis]